MTLEQTLKLLVGALEKAQEVLADDGAYPKTAAALDAPLAAGRAALSQMSAPVAAAVVPPSAEDCDKAAAQAMDQLAASKRQPFHALDLNPNVMEHHSLRRALIRAGFNLATQAAKPEAPAQRLTDEQIEFGLNNQLEDPSNDEAAAFTAGARWAESALKGRQP